MQSQPTPTPVHVSADGVCVVDGYGIEIKVERGHLVIADGIGPMRRRSRLSRATSGLRRLVLLGHTGFISLDAIRWLDDVGAAFVHIDKNGRLLLASASLGSDDGRLRRGLARLYGRPAGMDLARSILRRKLQAQRSLGQRLDADGLDELIDAALLALDEAVVEPAELMMPEAAAANAYWSAWSSLGLRWARLDAARIPDHWRTFGTRRSPVTGNNRLAANPANALLNYCYALLEAEVRFACLTVGLDPALGVLHADQRGRDSLVLDLMEPLRPEVDRAVLGLIESRTFRMSDFHETRQGNCRILAPLTHELARSLSMWRNQVAPTVEWFARHVAADTGEIDAIATPLTQANRSAGRAQVRRRPTPIARPPQLLLSTCAGCGGRVAARRRYCPACQPGVEVFQAVGSRALAVKRREGSDPAHGGEAAKIRGDKWRERQRFEHAWELEHGKTAPDEFVRQILPGLSDLPTRRLVEATGLSRAYCARILKGELVPHPRWWSVLEALVTGSGE